MTETTYSTLLTTTSPAALDVLNHSEESNTCGFIDTDSGKYSSHLALMYYSHKITRNPVDVSWKRRMPIQ